MNLEIKDFLSCYFERSFMYVLNKFLYDLYYWVFVEIWYVIIENRLIYIFGYSCIDLY